MSDRPHPSASDWALFAGFVGGAWLLMLGGCDGWSGTDKKTTVTFNRDVAPIVFEHCAACHRPGESAPFSLLSYDQVRKHAHQIADVVGRRFMPPWLPAAGHNRFEGERRLSDEQIDVFQNWAKQGAREGDADDLPPPPKFTAGWQLGKPDLVIEMTEPYTLDAEGLDVYRNFVIPIPVDRPRWVKAMELRAGNQRIVHHAFMLVDRTPASRNLDHKESVTGFGGMDTGPGAQSPDGHFISWQPGKRPTLAPQGMAWRLFPGSDLVLQIHMQPTGKPETIQAKIGIFFTDEPPRLHPVKLVLRSIDIDIPAGEKRYVIEDEFRTPVDLDVLGVIPHAHYLGKRLEGYATLPDGSRKWLILIEDWDFNWQGDYRCAKPVFVPKGSVLHMRFSYDNSAENVRNPNHPPQRVKYGLQSTDEMGEFWIQLLPRSPQDKKALQRAFLLKIFREITRRSNKALRRDPNDVKARIDLGKIALARRQMGQALRHFRIAAQYGPRSAAAQYYLGHVLLRSGQSELARQRLEAALKIDPDYVKAHHDLGMMHWTGGRLDDAARRFREALRIDRYGVAANSNLGEVLLAQRKPREAAKHFEQVLLVDPNNTKAKANLRRARAQ